MLGSRKLLLGPTAVLAAAGVMIGAGMADGASAPKNDKIVIKGGVKVKPGFYVQDMLRFTPFKSSVRKAGTISIVAGKGALDEGPHTFSLVKKSQLPKTGKQVNNCAVCQQIAQAHGADPNSQAPPPNPVVDGGDGFNKPGDSVFFDGHALKLNVTAPAGTTFYFLCALHPWMQGSIKVVK
jgi:hypothetical protein